MLHSLGVWWLWSLWVNSTVKDDRSLFGCTQSTEVRALGVCETLTVQEKRKVRMLVAAVKVVVCERRMRQLSRLGNKQGRVVMMFFFWKLLSSRLPSLLPLRRSSESEKARMSKSERWRGGFEGDTRHETDRSSHGELYEDDAFCYTMSALADNANDYGGGGGDGAIVQVNLGSPRSSPLPTCPWPLLPSLAMTRCVLLK